MPQIAVGWTAFPSDDGEHCAVAGATIERYAHRTAGAVTVEDDASGAAPWQSSWIATARFARLAMTKRLEINGRWS